MKPIDFQALLGQLKLTRLESAAEAGLWITSLPWPRMAARAVTIEGRSTLNLPLGRWWNADAPRRLFLAADGGASESPCELSLEGNANCLSGVLPPTAEMERFARHDLDELPWERHLLRLRYGDRSLGIAMGLRTGGKVHWWEACRLVVLKETPECRIVEMGGAIPHVIVPRGDYRRYQGVSFPYLHKHNWLNGRIYARLHYNGVCEIFAHHINSKFFDDGLPLEDVVPVIGFKTDDPVCDEGLWDGTRGEVSWGGVRFDLREVSRLATPEQPGQLLHEDGFLVLQPYAGVELYGGACPLQLTGDPFSFRAEQKVFPRGMARTLRFSISLSNRSPRVVRYLAPGWWYGLCEELNPEPILPVSNEYDRLVEMSRRWAREQIVQNGFEDGSLPRFATPGEIRPSGERLEPGWEGEISYAQFLTAWHTGSACDYAAAMRSAYYFTDVCVDHSAKMVRMHGFPPNAFSLPMNRAQGAIAAYLETGDPYLREAAEAITVTSHFLHRNSWPRLAVGRDACYLRSAVLLYRYFGEPYFCTIAQEGCLHTVQSQRKDGSFGDQGGGAGIHQWAAYIIKPWMGLLALNGVLDYLELFPDEPQLDQAILRFADWLMAERWMHQGVNGWSYQHAYNGTRLFTSPFEEAATPLPTEDHFHHDTLGRLLAYATLRTGNPNYLDAWAESYAHLASVNFDHQVAANLQFVPWIQAKLWGATPGENGADILLNPYRFGLRTPKSARIDAPSGKVAVCWTEAGGVHIEKPSDNVALAPVS